MGPAERTHGTLLRLRGSNVAGFVERECALQLLGSLPGAVLAGSRPVLLPYRYGSPTCILAAAPWSPPVLARCFESLEGADSAKNR